MAVNPSANRGFTLVELILFIIIVAVATSGLFAAINSSTVNNVNPLHQVRALELAQAQMDEIIGKRYDENSPSGGFPPCDSDELGKPDCSTSLGPESDEITMPSSSVKFDDVDDYHGFNTVPAAYGGYNMTVSVTGVTLAGRPAKLITVTVDSGANDPVALSAYRGNF